MTFYYIILNYLFFQVEMADNFRSEGKIYVVLFVVLLILVGIFFYLFRMEKKIEKIEKKNK